MPRTADHPVPVTLAEIARIAGVGRAAVSNWRRRYEDFPSPVGGSDSSPQFALSQVETWLRARGKLRETGAGLEMLWPLFEALSERDAMGIAVAEVGARALKEGSGPAASGHGLTDAQRHAVEKAMHVAQDEGGEETFTFLLTRWLGTHVRQIATTPEPLADLMAEIAGLSRATGPAHKGDSWTVLDPACGVGALLRAAARHWPKRALQLLGQDVDTVAAELASSCLELLREKQQVGPHRLGAEIRSGDTLRAPADGTAVADIVLCAPPSNERDWGHAELTADPRWIYGHPARTESELAWVQHALAALRPGGVAVLLLPPGVASRKAGRRIRAGLLRAGALRAVIALPPGAAPPHNVALHLWVLWAPGNDDHALVEAGSRVLFVDTASGPETGDGGSDKSATDWESVSSTVLAAVRRLGRPKGRLPQGAVTVPVVDLLDENTDLTPAHHIPAQPSVQGAALRDSWSRFTTLLEELTDLSTPLSELTAQARAGGLEDGPAPTTTIGELAEAGALSLRAGRQPTGIREGSPPSGGISVLTMADILRAGPPHGWLPAEEARNGPCVLTADGDIIVTAVARAFDAWVEEGAPTVLGTQMFALTVDPAALDPWFLAGCLRAPGNARRAGTHASAASRIDVKRLRLPLLPLAEQRSRGKEFRRLARFEQLLSEAGQVGARLVTGTGAALTNSRFGDSQR